MLFRGIHFPPPDRSAIASRGSPRWRRAVRRCARSSTASRTGSKSSPWARSRKTPSRAGRRPNARATFAIRRWEGKRVFARDFAGCSRLVYSLPMAFDLRTPTLLLDPAKVERNCRTMRERLEAQGVVLRPHVKTAKNLEVARLALGAESGPITVSTLREAEYFFDNGFKDILYAVGIAPAKLDRVIDLAGR